MLAGVGMLAGAGNQAIEGRRFELLQAQTWGGSCAGKYLRMYNFG